jgi:sodium transport system permease protein
MKKEGFSFNQVMIIYALIVFSFFYSGPFFFDRFGIPGISVTHVVSLLIPGIIIGKISEKNLKELYLLRMPVNNRYLILGIALWFVTLMVSAVYSYYASSYLPEEVELMESFDYLFSNTSFSTQMVIIALIPAIVEELLFRGLILSSLLQEKSVKTGLILSSFMFAAMHFSLIKLIPTFLLGLVFAYTVYKTKSVFSGIILHFINNAVAVWTTYYFQNYDIEFENVVIYGYHPNGMIILLVFFVITGQILFVKRSLNETK